VEKKFPGVTFSTLTDATYDIAGGLAVVQPWLTAHPTLKVVASINSGITQGAVEAMQKQNRLTGVKIYDMGGNTWAFNAVRQGTIKFTSVFLPATEGVDSVESVYNAWYKGQTGPHYVNILKSIPNPFLSKQNIGNKKAQYSG
jgi:ribose transport system substrate-binding protein